MSENDMEILERTTIDRLKYRAQDDNEAAKVLLEHISRERSSRMAHEAAAQMADHLVRARMGIAPKIGGGETVQEYNERVKDLGLDA